jgi:hypothetical protein
MVEVCVPSAAAHRSAWDWIDRKPATRASSSSSGTDPKNANVTCQFSGLTHRSSAVT